MLNHFRSSKFLTRTWIRIAIACFAITIAAALRIWPLQVLDSNLAWLTFYPAVTVVAIYGGLYYGLLATLLSCLLVKFCLPIFVVEPFIKNPADYLGMIVFILTCAMISGVAESMRRATAKAQSYRVLSDSMDEGYCVIEMIYSATGKPVDYRFLEINPAFEKHTGLQNAVGKTIRQMVPDHEAYWLEIYGKVASTGEAVRFESLANAMNRFYDVFAFRIGGDESRKVGLLFRDFTQEIQAKSQLVLAKENAEAANKLLKNKEVDLLKYELIIEASADGIIGKTADGIITSWSYGAGQILGYRKDEVIGENFSSLIPAQRLDEETKLMAQVYSGISVKNFETVCKHKNGNLINVEETISPIFDHDGKIVGVSKIVRDITDRITRRKIERQIESLRNESLRLQIDVESRSKAILQAMIDGMIQIDQNGIILYTNQAIDMLFGYSENELLGKNINMLMPEPYSFVHDSYLHKSTEGEPSKVIGRRVELPGLHKDGRIFTLDLSVTQLDLASGISFIGVMRDVSEAKQLQQELEQARISAESANKTKSDFLAIMSHEIRTPISAIIGFSFLAQRNELSQKALTYFKKINTAATILLDIINDILDFSKIEAGKLDMEVVTFNLDEVIENIASLFGSRSREKGIELSIGSTPGVPTWLSGDSLRLTQVLSNLISNAIKFTHQGEVTLLIEPVENVDNQTVLRFAVKDTGIGMTAEQLSILFKPFTQADSSTTRQFGGTGLGLVICKQLVEKMGGTISVESELNHGSTFSFNAKFGIVKDEVFSDSSFSGKRIIVVEDIDVMRRLLVGQLHFLKCDTEEIASGTELISKLKAGLTADSIIMDWRMPGMDGLVAARNVRDLGITIPIVLITGDDAESARAKAGDLVQLILPKPVSPAKLYNCLSTVFGGKTKKLYQGKDSGQVIIPDLSGSRILLVDDNEFNREVGTELIELTKAAIETANDGKQAVDAVIRSEVSGQYDLILLDIQMPVMDGYTAAEVIFAKYPGLPIIALTADVNTKDHDRLFKAGVRDILTKPIQADKLYKTFVKVLAERASEIKEGAKALPESVGEIEGTMQVDELPELPGFDTSAALERLGGNVAMYRRFLCMFRDRNAFSIQSFHLILEHGEIAEARRAMHTLKGTAGSIGAVDLAKMGESLEIELEISKDSIAILSSAMLKNLETEWERVMSLLAKLTA